MRVLLDACIMAATFDPANDEHGRFRPLLNWLRNSPEARLVSGGAKYKLELGHLKQKKYVALLAEFQRARKWITLDDQEVDREAQQAKQRCPEAAFNDEHLAAIIIVGKCRLLATNDLVAAGYVSKRKVFPPGMRKPKIYLSAEHSTLLTSPKGRRAKGRP